MMTDLDTRRARVNTNGAIVPGRERWVVFNASVYTGGTEHPHHDTVSLWFADAAALEAFADAVTNVAAAVRADWDAGAAETPGVFA